MALSDHMALVVSGVLALEHNPELTPDEERENAEADDGADGSGHGSGRLSDHELNRVVPLREELGEAVEEVLVLRHAGNELRADGNKAYVLLLGGLVAVQASDDDTGASRTVRCGPGAEGAYLDEVLSGVHDELDLGVGAPGDLDVGSDCPQARECVVSDFADPPDARDSVGQSLHHLIRSHRCGSGEAERRAILGGDSHG